MRGGAVKLRHGAHGTHGSLGAWRLEQDLQQLGSEVLEMPHRDALPSHVVVSADGE